MMHYSKQKLGSLQINHFPFLWMLNGDIIIIKRIVIVHKQRKIEVI